MILSAFSNTILASFWVSNSEKIHTKAEKAMAEGNFAIAYSLWEPLAKDGDSKAQFNIGWMFHNGYGLAINDDIALTWWLQAAEQGYTDAFYSLANLYSAGFGVDKDLDIAMGWYIAAAEKGHDASLEIIHALVDRADKLSKKYYAQLLEDQWFLRSALKGNKKSLSILLSLAKNKETQKYFSKILKENWSLFDNKMVIKVSRANVRRGPSKQYKIITSLYAGHKLIKLAQKGNWVQIGIAQSGRVAWIFKSLIEPLDKSLEQAL